MTDFQLRYEWESSEGIGSAELAATWARLEIWAGDECITQVEDRLSKSTRRSIYGSLYPLAEWAAYNWWLLLANVRLAGVVRSPANLRHHYSISRAHNLRAAGDGFIWPNAAIVPEGGTTRVVWTRDKETNEASPIRFVSDGVVMCTPSSVQQVLGRLVENVLARLDEAELPDTALADEWRAITEADDDEVAFCVASARLGLDPYSLDEGRAHLIETIGSRLEQQLLGDFLDAVDPDAMDSGVAWIAQTVKALRDIQAQPNPIIEELRAAVTPSTNGFRPWELGWEHARRARKILSIEPEVPFKVEDLIAVAEEPYSDRGLVAVGGLTGTGGHAIVTGHRLSDNAKRFATARALWHFAGSRDARFLLTAAHADRQKIERAFAAELLAPAAGVDRLIGDDDGVVSFEDLELAAEHFQVSTNVVQHQVENQLELAVAD